MVQFPSPYPQTIYRCFTVALLAICLCAAYPSAGQTAGKVVGVAWADLGASNRSAEDNAIRAAVEASGDSYVSTDAQASASRQIADIDGLISRGVHVLIVVAQDSSALVPAVEKALAAGIPVIAYDRMIAQSDVLYVGFDDRLIGRAQTQAALRAKPQGNYAFIKGPADDPLAEALFSGQLAALGQALDTGAVKNIGELHTESWSSANARRNMEQILTYSDNQVDAVIASDDAIAGGVSAALQKQGLAGSVAVVGQGAGKEALNRIALGTQTATVWKDVRELGYAAGDIASELAEGKKPADIAGAVDIAIASGEPGKAVFPAPVTITRDNLGLAIEAGRATREEVCAGVAASPPAACE
jgi:D-xylose transport system substrate-binding protein